MKKIRIAGVPEHFNLPWHMAMEEGAFEERGIKAQWTDVPEGTGRMCQLLEKGETDLAIILTEGVVKSIVEGNPSRILQEYVASPLLWGVHVAASSNFEKETDLQHQIAAISRPGSGSHLMAYLHAQGMGWDPSKLSFKTVHHLEGAVTSLTEGSAHYFLWERFTTKPLVKQGVFRRLADFPTPWPCFVIAARLPFIEEDAGALRHVLDTINRYTATFRNIPGIEQTIANRYGQQLEDVRQWLSLTRWSQSQLETNTLMNVQDTLARLSLIPGITSAGDITYHPR